MVLTSFLIKYKNNTKVVWQRQFKEKTIKKSFSFTDSFAHN